MKLRAAAFLSLAVLMGTPAGAYYHYVHYLTRNAPFTALPEKYNLNALPNRTVTVFVNDSGPTAFGPNDSFASVLSQIRQATLAWNAVETSDLRMAFGGLIQGSTNPNTPGIEVEFGDLPGVLGLTFRERSGSPIAGPSGPFYPITRARAVFNRDLTVRPGPSYLDSFFTTAVHEFGHALGLQHTFTSSAMTVAVNRNVNRSRPLDADDIAGLSLLYPRAGYLAGVGSITGRVTSNGQGVNLGSVVALRPSGPAISTLTAPDGTYRLEGLPPDTYYVYVHPIPPDANLDLPTDASGQPFPHNVPFFETLFYPGVRELTQFHPINVGPGATVGGINFSVAPRQSAPVFEGSTYSFYGTTPVRPASVVSTASGITTFVFQSSPSTPVPQRAQVLGLGDTAANLRVRPYDSGGFISVALDIFQFPLGAGTGPRHLLLTFENDMFVLPSALNLVQKQPPQITGVVPISDGNVLVTGTNMGIDTRVFFDGLPAAIRTPFSGSGGAGAILVAPPPGFGGQRATVAVFNADGQNSLMLQSQNPPLYSYPSSDSPQIAASLNSLPAGASAVVEIAGINTRFVEGQVTVGFGTNDVFVRKVWVLGPNRILANVSALPNAAPGASEISVISGFQTILQPFAFITQAANPRQPVINLPLANVAANQTNFYPGAAVTMTGSNLALTPASVTVTLTDANGNTVPAQIASAQGSQVTFLIPPSMPTGVATLRLNNGADAALPLAIQIDPQPPVIALISASGQALDSSRAVSAGEVLELLVTGLDPSVSNDRLKVLAFGIELPITHLQTAGQNGLTQVQIVLTQSFGGQQVPISISQDGTVSNPYLIAIR